MIIGLSADELIKMGKISPYHYYAPDLNIDFSNVKKTGGDYNNQQLGEAMSSKRIYGDILKYYKLLANDKSAIAYCTNVSHSKEVCEMFNNNNIPARHIDATTPEKEREEALNAFENGEFKILCNCNLISEGITLPIAEACLMLRKTASLPLFIQQGCRALTPVEGKIAIIIDYVNNIQSFGFPTSRRQWSLDSKVKEYDNENDDGTFKIRVCQNCFSTFEAAPVCPYCGAVYETTATEIQNFKEIELRKVEEEKEARRQEIMHKTAEKVVTYQKPEECRNFYELVEFGKMRGYKPGWAVFQAKRLHLLKK
jgi:superfamily II DNA or RNA helicase